MSGRASFLVALAAVGVPALTGAVLALAKVSARRARKAARLVAALAGLGLGIALVQGQRAPLEAARFPVPWLAGTGSLTLAPGLPGLSVALATTVAFVLAMRRCEDRYGLGLVALGAANLALVAGDFMGRYVALEVVGVCVAAAHLVPLGGGAVGESGSRAARQTYMILRFGDAGLLMAILLLWRLTGTLAIGEALDAATSTAAGMPGGSAATAMAWSAVGLALAAWVKAGAWPMQVWVESAHGLSPLARSWLVASVMPNLALYLLSRVSPLLAAVPLVAPILRAVGVIGAYVGGAGALVLARSGRWRRSLVYLGAVQGALAMTLAAAGEGNAVGGANAVSGALVAVAVLVTPLRLAMDAWVPSGDGVAGGVPTHWRPMALAAAGAGLFATWGWALSRLLASGANAISGALVASYVGLLPILGWSVLAARGSAGGATAPSARAPADPAMDGVASAVQRWIERGVLGGLVTTVARGALLASRAAHDVVERRLLGGIEGGVAEGVMGASKAAHGLIEERLLGGLEAGLARGVLKASQATHVLVERGTLDGSLRLGARLVRGLSRELRRRHTGRLRHNIAWLGVTLVALMVWVILG